MKVSSEAAAVLKKKSLNLNKMATKPKKTEKVKQPIGEIDDNEVLNREIKELNQINTIKTSKYLEDLTNKGD